MKLLYFLLGYEVIEADGADGARLIDTAYKNSVPFIDCMGAPDGSVRITCKSAAAKKLHGMCEKNGISEFCVKIGGILPRIKPLLKRYGLIAGLICAVVIAAVSGRFLWDVRVSGNSDIASSEVLAYLKENGVSVGRYIPGINAASSEKGVLLCADGKISWIAVNIKGTVAYVEIMENRVPETESEGYANVVASVSGVVEHLEVVNGNPIVRTGDVVAEGEVLISGVYGDGEYQQIGFTRAAGAVYARTVGQICFTLPRIYEKKVYTGARKVEKSVNFFGENINISKKYSNCYKECDIIKREYVSKTRRGEDFPFGYSQTEYLEYTLESAEYSDEDLTALAEIKLSESVCGLVGDGTLLSAATQKNFTADGLTVNCTVTYVGNIAVTRPFEVEK